MKADELEVSMWPVSGVRWRETGMKREDVTERGMEGEWGNGRA